MFKKLFNKDLFKKALQPTKEGWFSKAMHLFDRVEIDEATWTELEELLIAADVGMATTEKLIERTRKKVKEDRLKDGAQVREALKKEIIAPIAMRQKGLDLTQIKVNAARDVLSGGLIFYYSSCLKNQASQLFG